MNGHPQFEEDLDLLVLGALEGEERQVLRAHLSGCTSCTSKLEEVRGRLSVLALAVPLESAPSSVRERLLRRARTDAARLHRGAAPAPWRWLTFALAAVSLVLAIAAGLMTLENRDLKYRLGELQAAGMAMRKESAHYRAVLDLLTAPDTVKVTLLSGPAKPVPQGKAFYHPQKGLLFYAANLPTLPPNQTYQLWLIPTAGNPISAGVFDVDPHGNGQVVLPKLPTGVAAKAFAVTVEPSGGVPQPTGRKVLVGAVS